MQFWGPNSDKAAPNRINFQWVAGLENDKEFGQTKCQMTRLLLGKNKFNMSRLQSKRTFARRI